VYLWERLFATRTSDNDVCIVQNGHHHHHH